MTHDANFNWAIPTAPAHIIYQLRHTDAGDELLEAATLDAVMDSIIDDGGEFDSATFDALIVTNARIETKAQQLGMAFNRAAGAVKLVDNGVTVSKPFKQNGSTQIAMLFEMSDGQIITVYLHNPDVKPNQLQAADVLISWKWLLNRKDITIVVAPENGKDLALAQVATRIMALLDKNSARFTKANAGRAARLELIAGLEAQVTERETTLQGLIEQLEAKKMTPPETESSNWYADADDDKRSRLMNDALIQLGWIKSTFSVTYTYHNAAKAGVLNPEGLFTITASLTDGGRWYQAVSGFDTVTEQDLRGMSPDNIQEHAQQFHAGVMAWIEQNGGTAKHILAKDLDVGTPDNYATVMANEPLIFQYQNQLEAIMRQRLTEAKESLRATGWEGGDFILRKNGVALSFATRHVGVEQNLIAYSINGIADDLTQTPQAFAASVAAAIEKVNTSTSAGKVNEAEDLTTVAGIARAIQLRFAAKEYEYNEESMAQNNNGGMTLEQLNARVDQALQKPPIAPYVETAEQIVNKDYTALIDKFAYGIFDTSEKLFKEITGVKINGLSRAAKTTALLKWGGLSDNEVAAYFKTKSDAEQAKIDAQAAAKATAIADKKAQLSLNYSGYLDSMSDMQAGKVIAALNKPFHWRDLDDTVHQDTFKSYAENAIARGVDVRTVNRSAKNEQGYKTERVLADFYESQLNTTVVNYAEYLQTKRLTPTVVEPESAVAAASPDETTAFLQAVIDGTTDLNDPTLGSQLSAMYAETVNDEVKAVLYEQAVHAYSNHALGMAASLKPVAA